MKLLAIDASTEACSVALGIDQTYITRYVLAPRGHAQRLLVMVDEVLQEAGIALTELDGLVFDRGPGSFTGVRISTSVCQGLAFGAELPVVAISSLAAIAQGVLREKGEERVLSVIDARMNEVYAGWFKAENGTMTPVSEEWLGKAGQIIGPDSGTWYGAGSGWQAYGEQLCQAMANAPIGIDANRLPQAEDLLILAQSRFQSGHTLKPEQALPTYLRNEVTWKKTGV